MMAGILLILVSTLVIGCSSEPAAPAAPVPNFTEEEVISMAKGHLPECFSNAEDFFREMKTAINMSSSPAVFVNPGFPGSSPKRTYTNLSRTVSASFKNNGLWLIITKASWNEKVESVSNANVRTVVSDGPDEMTCNIRLNDNTGSFISD